MTAHAIMAMRTAQVRGFCKHRATVTCLQELARTASLSRNQIQPNAETLPLVFCGDFNFKPASFPYLCLTTGKHALNHVLPHAEEHKKAIISGWKAPYLQPMASMYAAAYGTEPVYTNNCIQRSNYGEPHENVFCETLDYIFANARVNARGALQLPAEGPRLPNKDHPSDHLPVVADVEFC